MNIRPENVKLGVPYHAELYGQPGVVVPIHGPYSVLRKGEYVGVFVVRDLYSGTTTEIEVHRIIREADRA